MVPSNNGQGASLQSWRYTPPINTAGWSTPKRRDASGRLTPIASMPARDRDALMEVLTALKRALLLGAIPTELWNRYVELAPRCECSITLSPERAARPNVRFCSARCYQLHHKRMSERRRRYQRRERESLAEAIGQT